MPFQPNVSDELHIGQQCFIVEPHPLSADVPYGQEGRQGTVYQLRSTDDQSLWALKVFRPTFRFPALVHQAEKLADFADIPSLQVCERQVLTPQHHFSIISKHPELLYAVLMPWADGSTWMDIVVDRRALTRDCALRLSESLAESLSEMEQRGLAHGDISAANVILLGVQPDKTDILQDGSNLIAYVDVEQMYGPGLHQPQLMPAGSPGYARKKGGSVEWSAAMDRFAGGVMLAEMLAWCDEDIRGSAWGESYFDPERMLEDKERSARLFNTLTANYGKEVAFLFQRTWSSQENTQCPTFGEWMLTLKAIRFPQGEPVGIERHEAERPSESGTAHNKETGTRESRLLKMSQIDHASTPSPVAEKSMNEKQSVEFLEHHDTNDAVEKNAINFSVMAQVNAVSSAVEISISDQINEALQAEQAGRWEDAIQQYERLLQHVPAHSDVGSELVIARQEATDKWQQAKEEESLRMEQLAAKRKQIQRVSIMVAAALIVLGSSLFIWAPWKQQWTEGTQVSGVPSQQPVRTELEKENKKEGAAISPTPTPSKPTPTKQDPAKQEPTEQVKPTEQKKPVKPDSPTKNSNRTNPTNNKQEPTPKSPSSHQPDINNNNKQEPDKPQTKQPISQPPIAKTPKPKPKPDTTTEQEKKQEEHKKQKEQLKEKQITELEEQILQAFNVEDDTDKVIRLSKELKKIDANNALAKRMLQELTGG